MAEAIFGIFPWWFFVVIIVLSIWEMIWKGIALWKAGRNNHIGWFVAIFIVNTIGILPIIYLAWFQPKKSETVKKRR